MCQLFDVHRSGFYAWLKKPESKRSQEDKIYLGMIKQFWLESGCAYGYRNIYYDLIEAGESIGKNRVYKLMNQAKIQSQRGYKRHKGFKASQALAAPNKLLRQFKVDKPNQSWVTDFTYIRTYEGWLYLTIVMDLFSRQIIGWSMKSSPKSDLVIDALLMAIWRRKPKERVLIHSDQGVQYTCSDWKTFLADNNLEASMSRRGNCHDNAVAESFFSLLKTERIKRRVFKTREEARQEIFEYIELYYNSRRRHSHNGNIAPCVFEKEYETKLLSV